MLRPFSGLGLSPLSSPFCSTLFWTVYVLGLHVDYTCRWGQQCSTCLGCLLPAQSVVIDPMYTIGSLGVQFTIVGIMFKLCAPGEIQKYGFAGTVNPFFLTDKLIVCGLRHFGAHLFTTLLGSCHVSFRAGSTLKFGGWYGMGSWNFQCESFQCSVQFCYVLFNTCSFLFLFFLCLVFRRVALISFHWVVSEFFL